MATITRFCGLAPALGLLAVSLLCLLTASCGIKLGAFDGADHSFGLVLRPQGLVTATPAAGSFSDTAKVTAALSRLSLLVAWVSRPSAGSSARFFTDYRHFVELSSGPAYGEPGFIRGVHQDEIARAPGEYSIDGETAYYSYAEDPDSSSEHLRLSALELSFDVDEVQAAITSARKSGEDSGSRTVTVSGSFVFKEGAVTDAGSFTTEMQVARSHQPYTPF